MVVVMEISVLHKRAGWAAAGEGGVDQGRAETYYQDWADNDESL